MIVGLAGVPSEQILVVGVIMQLAEASRQPEVRQLYMTAVVKQDVIGLDITKR